jgi:hypothetical protein
MNHHKVAKEQLLHLVFGAAFFLVIGILAVSLDLLAAWITKLGVSQFTASTLGWTAHAMLVLDLVLFFIYLIATSIDLIRGMK